MAPIAAADASALPAKSRTAASGMPSQAVPVESRLLRYFAAVAERLDAPHAALTIAWHEHAHAKSIAALVRAAAASGSRRGEPASARPHG